MNWRTRKKTGSSWLFVLNFWLNVLVGLSMIALVQGDQTSNIFSDTNSLTVKSKADNLDASMPFAQTIDDEIVCSQVLRLHGRYRKEKKVHTNERNSVNPRDVHNMKNAYTCIVDEKYSISGARGIMLEILDFDETFEAIYEEQMGLGHTELVVQNSVIEHSTMRLYKEYSTTQEAANIIEENIFEEQVDLIRLGGNSSSSLKSRHRERIKGNKASKLKWRKPHNPGVETVKRKLNSNTIGNRSVVVFRITTSTLTPTYFFSAEIISQQIFDPSNLNIVSIYSGCSNNQLNFYAPSEVEGLTFAASGVIEKTISTTDSTSPIDIGNTLTALYGSSIDLVDHVFVQVPYDMKYNNALGWIAFANQGGKFSFYNDANILNAQTMVHEIGHNLGLLHSGERGEGGEEEEYFDTTCNMGYRSATERSQCFNGAKSVELGWYQDRVVTIDPSNEVEFVGRMIGVNDYSISTLADTLVLEILNPDPTADSFYLMYNYAEDINSDVDEARNKLVLVQGGASKQSWKLLEIEPGSTEQISDFVDGRSLLFVAGATSVDSGVDYVPLTVSLENVNCSSDSDCNRVISSCFTRSCTLGLCEYPVTDNCCGNGICEATEFCSTCNMDCVSPTNCNEVDSTSEDGLPFGFGIIFELQVHADISFSEIELVSLYTSQTLNARLYTKEGAINGDTSVDSWEEIHNGAISAYLNKVNFLFPERKVSSAGSVRSFYIVFDTENVFKWLDNVPAISNEHVTITTTQITQASTGTSIGSILEGYFPAFNGQIKYNYENSYYSSSPSSVPSLLPSLSFSPSDLPSSIPSISQGPSMEPSELPSQLPSKIPVGPTPPAPTPPAPTPPQPPIPPPTKKPTLMPTMFPTRLTASPTERNTMNSLSAEISFNGICSSSEESEKSVTLLLSDENSEAFITDVEENCASKRTTALKSRILNAEDSITYTVIIFPINESVELTPDRIVLKIQQELPTIVEAIMEATGAEVTAGKVNVIERPSASPTTSPSFSQMPTPSIEYFQLVSSYSFDTSGRTFCLSLQGEALEEASFQVRSCADTHNQLFYIDEKSQIQSYMITDSCMSLKKNEVFLDDCGPSASTTRRRFQYDSELEVLQIQKPNFIFFLGVNTEDKYNSFKLYREDRIDVDGALYTWNRKYLSWKDLRQFPTSSPTMTPECLDSSVAFGRFIKPDGTSVTKSCKWVARKDTQSRCQLKHVANFCPHICSGNCNIDTETRFSIAGVGTKSCEWVKRIPSKRKQRCSLKEVSMLCRATCSDEFCTDSPLIGRFIKVTGEVIDKPCSWVSNKHTERRCSYQNVASLCPSTCSEYGGQCEVDAEGRFKVNGVWKSCNWVSNLPEKIPERCSLQGGAVAKTCRQTCTNNI